MIRPDLSEHQVTYFATRSASGKTLSTQIIGGINSDGTEWQTTLKDAIAGIELGRWRFWVEKQGHPEYLVVEENEQGEKFLTTRKYDKMIRSMRA